MAIILSRNFIKGSFRSQVSKSSRLFSSHLNDGIASHRPYKDETYSELARNGAMFFAMSQGVATWGMPVVESFIGKSKHLDKAIEFGLDKTAMKMFFIGKNQEEANETVIREAKKNKIIIYDYSPEGSENPSSEYYEDVANVVVDSAEEARKVSRQVSEQLAPAIAIKIPASPKFMERVSGMLERGDVLSDGDKKEWEATQKRVLDIFEAAQGKGKKKVDVYVDAEWTAINPAIDKLAEIAVEKGYDPIETVQCYLKDSPNKITKMIAKGRSVKLVRGAYMDSEIERAENEGRPSPVFDSKQETDDNYDNQLKRLVESGNRVVAATHNEKSAFLAGRLKEENPDADITLATLKGMPAPYCGDKVKQAIYGPWVKNVLEGLPYFVRRTKDNAGSAADRGIESVSSEFSHRFRDSIAFESRER